MDGHPVSRVRLLQGSLYPALHRLEAKGWIDARFYCFTRLGRKQLATERSKWEAFSSAMGLILDPAREEGK